MSFRPFLTQFAVDRDDIHDFKLLKIQYNEELDCNEIVGDYKSIDLLNISGQTSAKMKPERLGIINRFRYLQSKTLTETKSESPDRLSNRFINMMLMTETSTKVQSESPDKDY